MPSQPCYMNEQEVNHSFLAGAPMIAKTIFDLSQVHPSFLSDTLQMEEWPLGQGATMKQLFFRGGLPAIEENLDQWKRIANTTGPNPCVGDCGYNITMLSGNGFDEKEVELGERQFRSPSFCVKQIQTTYMYDQVFAMIVQNLYRQIAFMKEVNIAHNILSNLSKKLVIDSGGPKPNLGNPYMYPNVGVSTILGTLNIDFCEILYEQMRYLPSCVPYAMQNGSPMFAMMCSQQLISHMYRDDPSIRQDARFSGAANDLVSKYNFTKTIRDMFIPATILYPRRFNRLADGTLERVLPYINNVPALTGEYTTINPAYLTARYEEVLFFGKWPAKIFFMPTAQTLGEGSSFGPEYAWFDSFQWINPQTPDDPLRRQGYYLTTATLGVCPQFSEGLFAVLVERPSVQMAFSAIPHPTCPTVPEVCSNEIPSTGCPCPLILGPITPSPTVAGRYFITLAVPTTARAEDSIHLGLRQGGYVTATVVSVSTDGLHVEVSMSVTPSLCDQFVSIYCDETRGCYSDVLSFGSCGLINQVLVYLKNPIKADVGETVTAYFGDGSSASLTIAAVDLMHNAYTLNLASAMCGTSIIGVCVPPGTDATCPACGNAPTYTVCVS